MTPFDATYWEERYRTGQTGWDAGAVTTPLKAYFDRLNDLSLRVLIPGGGHSYEAAYLFARGFRHVWVLDVAPTPLQRFRERHPDFPADQLLQEDFFAHHQTYDLIVEQTFLSTLPPALRPAYARQMHALLRPGGRLMGVLFDDPLFDDHPPFGGSMAEYEALFRPWFHFRHFGRAYNSILPRQGREVFICLEKLAEPLAKKTRPD